MNIVEIITKKKNNLELTTFELDYAFNGYLKGTVSPEQMSALLMAIVINGMSYDETINLTKLFIDSGDVYDLSSLGKVIVDKHSTGGVGDSTTMVVGPIVAACDLIMAKMSGKGLGHTGGTIDKLESIPGFKTDITKEKFMELSKKIGFCISRQTETLVPMDKAIYDLRNLTGTTESIPLIASSIMSKKIASGASIILIDIKVGNGALIKNYKDAEILSDWLIKIGEAFKRKVITIKTDMNIPLGDSIGNAIEVLEAIKILKGKDSKLKNVCIEIATKLVSTAKNIGLEDAYEEVSNVIKSGKALDKFSDFVESQGGDLSKLNLEDRVLVVKAKKSGKLKKIDALKIGELSVKLGVNKTNKDDTIQYGTGIRFLKNKGDILKVGDSIAYLFVTEEVNLKNEDLECFEIE